MHDCIAKRKAALLRSYRCQQLHLDGVVSLAFHLGLDDREVGELLEQLASFEPDATARERQRAMLVRGYRRLGLVDVLYLADLLGFDEEDKIELIDSCGELDLDLAA